MIKSKLFKPLKQFEIDSVVAHLYGSRTKIRVCRLLKGGLFNTSYFIRTAAADDAIVLRVAPVNQHLLFDFEQSMMSAEPLFYQMLHKKNIPTSTVVYHDNSFDVIAREYIVFEHIPSVSMNDVTVPPEAKAKLYGQLGGIVRALHEITYEQFGWLRPRGEQPMFGRWSAFLQCFAAEIADKAANQGLFDDEELTRFLMVFDETAVFDQIVIARMVHADLWEGNVLLSDNGGDWEVVALIDVDKVVFGDAAFEFAFPTLLKDPFLHGYGRQALPSSEELFRHNSYRLLQNFMYAYVWSAQLAHRERFEAAKQDGLSDLALL